MRAGLPALVREATLADADAVGEVHAEAWRVAYRDLFEGEWLDRFVARRRSQWTARMAAPEFTGTTLLLAVRGARVSAFAHFGPHSTDAARRHPDGEIYECYAHPSVWGTGLADLLMDSTWEALTDAGYPQVRLWTMAGANRARRFYTRAGFRETGRTGERDFGDGRPVLQVEYARSTR